MPFLVNLEVHGICIIVHNAVNTNTDTPSLLTEASLLCSMKELWVTSSNLLARYPILTGTPTANASDGLKPEF
jgi:hypothetical protein